MVSSLSSVALASAALLALPAQAHLLNGVTDKLAAAVERRGRQGHLHQGGLKARGHQGFRKVVRRTDGESNSRFRLQA